MDALHHLLHDNRPPPPTLLARITSHPITLSITSNPLNIFLFLVLLYHLSSFLPKPLSHLTPTLKAARRPASSDSSTYNVLPEEHPKSTVWMDYTPMMLSMYDGTGKKGAREPGSRRPERGPPRILLSINRLIFDVTPGARFYGPGGPYGNFAGRDASRGMALQSFDLEVLTPLDAPLDKLEDLKPAERKQLMEWEEHFRGKYNVVGRLVEEGEVGRRR